MNPETLKALEEKIVKFSNSILFRWGYRLQKFNKDFIDTSILPKPPKNQSKKEYDEIASQIDSWAKQYGYISTVERFYCDVENGQSKLRIFFKPLAVVSVLKHPKKGETALRRECGSMKEVEDILRSPRIHMGLKSQYLKLKKYL